MQSRVSTPLPGHERIVLGAVDVAGVIGGEENVCYRKLKVSVMFGEDRLTAERLQTSKQLFKFESVFFEMEEEI